MPRPAMTRNDFRHNAIEDQDPLMLGGQDIIHYAELLIRFRDHQVLSPGYQFWGRLADYWNSIHHLPDQPGRHSDRAWREFNQATAMAVGYVRDVSAASNEYKLELLNKFFRPEPEQEN